MLDEGLAIVKGARDRHDGIARNPWNEFECGHHYARAMASWSLILALSGYRYSAPEKSISFAPKVNAADFRCFYSTGSGWGVFSQKIAGAKLTASIGVAWGELELAESHAGGARLAARRSLRRWRARWWRRRYRRLKVRPAVTLSEPVKIGAGEALEVGIL